ncbi:MAG: heavy-metal-associated domain-containing protein [Bacteroidetes bacterium]|nr:MAG: heavy-metal-associated domain-containing protein [Bacteroidota bacterium]
MMHKLFFIFIFLFFANVSQIFAQSEETLSIKTSAVCEMCKSKIEKEMSFAKGVKSAVLDVESKALTVVFKKDKTDAQKLRQIVANIGYDADDVKANEKKYKKLPACCQKGGM